MNATRTEFNGTGWDCPAGTSPCSTDTDLSGSTVCLDPTSSIKCPVTDLALLPDDSTDPRLTDSSYTQVSGTFDVGKMTLVYTTNSPLSRSNAPLQSITWQLNQPCAYTDQ